MSGNAVEYNKGFATQDKGKCMVCLYRRDGFDDGPSYPVNVGTMHGISLIFEADILVCPEHLDYADYDGAHSLEEATR